MTEHEKNTLMLKGLLASMPEAEQSEVRRIIEEIGELEAGHDKDLFTMALTLITAERVQ